MSTLPVNEETFLKRNAFLSLILGIYFTYGWVYIAIEPNFIIYAWLKPLCVVIGAIVMTFLIGSFFKALKSMEGINKTTVFYGNFEDEYLNFVASQGVRYAFSFVWIYLMVIYLAYPYFEDFFSGISIQLFAKYSMGLIFISYALPVLYLLQRSNDE
ncbi:hypothetical protein [Colwellia sp. RSH04]|uniref:hypothetical protein n=1 Tax=Colwellia sp. RSH04 TaxID=2305464 RepID=UPI000E58AF1E|nr:hypothetical protein [Colwellia sp. RSH04]RHW76272.1 hypothetical protein D1094_08075 [Colwellia sp. RSH04]